MLAEAGVPLVVLMHPDYPVELPLDMTRLWGERRCVMWRAAR